MRSSAKRILWIIRWPFAAVAMCLFGPVFLIISLVDCDTEPLEDWWHLVREELFDWSDL